MTDLRSVSEIINDTTCNRTLVHDLVSTLFDDLTEPHSHRTRTGCHIDTEAAAIRISSPQRRGQLPTSWLVTTEDLIDAIIEWAHEALRYAEDTPDLWLAVAVRVLAGLPTRCPVDNADGVLDVDNHADPVWVDHILDTAQAAYLDRQES